MEVTIVSVAEISEQDYSHASSRRLNVITGISVTIILSIAVFPWWGIWYQSSARGGKFVTYRFLNFDQFKQETLWYMYINSEAY